MSKINKCLLVYVIPVPVRVYNLKSFLRINIPWAGSPHRLTGASLGGSKFNIYYDR